MAYFVVTYDLKQKDWEDYDTLIKELDKMSSVKYQESCWFVDQQKTAAQVFSQLKAYLHEDDSLMVVEFLKKPSWRKGLPGTKAWIGARFPE